MNLFCYGLSVDLSVFIMVNHIPKYYKERFFSCTLLTQKD